MATKDTIEIDVNVGDGAKSMRTLKKEFQDLQMELDGLVPGTQKYIDTLKRLGAVKDEIGDLKNEIAAFAGNDAKVAAFGNVIGGVASGFQAATGAAALFGAENEDLQKSLVKVQAAMAFTDGIKGVFAMGDSLKAAGNVAKNLVTQLIGVETQTKLVAAATRIWNAIMAANPIMLLVAGVTAAVGAFVLLSKAFEENKSESEKLTEAYEKQKAANDEIRTSIDNEITALSGLKANEEEIIKLKEKKIALSIQDAEMALKVAQYKEQHAEEELGLIDKLTKGYTDLTGNTVISQGIVDKAKKKASEETKKAIDDLNKIRAEQQAFNNEQTQKKIDADKAAYEKWKALEAQRVADAKAFAKEVADYTDAQNKERADKAKREQEEKDKLEAEEIERQIQEEFKKFEADKAKRLEAQKKYDEERKASDDAVKQSEEKAIDSIRGLTEGLFAFRLRAAKGNAAEELKIRKQQFAVDKAFNLARAIQDGIRSVQAALTIPPPGGQILAGINAAISAGNVAKIAATQFEGGEVGAGAVSFQGLSSGATFSQAPAISTGGNNQTQLNSDGSINRTAQPQVVKAYVVESEATASINRVNKLSNQSKIG